MLLSTIEPGVDCHMSHFPNSCLSGMVTDGKAVVDDVSTEHYAKFVTEKIPLAFAMSKEFLSAAGYSRVFIATYNHMKKGVKGLGRIQTSSSWRPSTTITCASVNAEGGTVEFTPDGSMAILEAKLQQDKTNVSYYGNSTLHAAGATCPRKIDLVNALSSPVHAFATRPGTSQVMISYGPLPAKLRLVDSKSGKGEGNFGENRRNHFRFSPCGNWLLMGGYGSLNGDSEVYNLTDGEVIGAARLVDNVVAEWFADGQHIVLGSTAPRLRVDNKLMVMRYNCEVLLTEQYECLTHILPQPISYEKAKIEYPPIKPKHLAMKNVVEGVKSYIPPAQRRRMEAEGTAKSKIGVIKAQGSNAKMTGELKKQPAIPEKPRAKVGYKLPY
eukprot:GHVH01006501.1.p1 GENE.GHVH01006501.1~~GHVH01006501.1.p1  ORF type:complete len:384 (-),score=33.86 GHVH01006501.1:273-1424(-)